MGVYIVEKRFPVGSVDVSLVSSPESRLFGMADKLKREVVWVLAFAWCFPPLRFEDLDKALKVLQASLQSQIRLLLVSWATDWGGAV